METNNLVIFHPNSSEQISALKALAKLLKLDIEITTQEKLEKKVSDNKEKQRIFNDIREAVDELKMVKSGKKKSRNVEDLLNEL